MYYGEPTYKIMKHETFQKLVIISEKQNRWTTHAKAINPYT